jgi:predicted DNA-binding transcriptional regulator YafY
MRFSNQLIGVVLDRFGKDIIIAKDGDSHFCVTLPIAVSPQFLGFLFSLGTDAEILRPDHVRNKMKDLLKEVSEKY